MEKKVESVESVEKVEGLDIDSLFIAEEEGVISLVGDDGLLEGAEDYEDYEDKDDDDVSELFPEEEGDEEDWDIF